MGEGGGLTDDELSGECFINQRDIVRMTDHAAALLKSGTQSVNLTGSVRPSNVVPIWSGPHAIVVFVFSEAPMPALESDRRLGFIIEGIRDGFCHSSPAG